MEKIVELGEYARCLNCPHRERDYKGTRCSGPDISRMTMKQLCMWFRALKNKEGYTNKSISDKAKVSLQTVTNIMALSPPNDLRWYTVTSINNVLADADGDTTPCAVHLLVNSPDTIREIEQTRTEINLLQDILSNIHESYKNELAIIRQEAKEKIDFLKAENEKKDRIINRLLDR